MTETGAPRPLTETTLAKWIHHIWHTGATVDGHTYHSDCPGPEACTFAMKVIDTVPPPKRAKA